MSHGKSPRFDVIFDLKNRVPRHVEVPRDEEGHKLKISEYFGVNTFGLSQMRDKLPSDVYQKLRSTIEHGKKLDSGDRQRRRARHQGMGARARRHALLPLVPAADGLHRGEARRLSHVRRPSARPIEKFSGVPAHSERAGRVELPLRRHAHDVRGARLHGVGPVEPGLHHGARERHRRCAFRRVFISYHGDALDEKTALVRSVEVLSTRATELLARDRAERSQARRPDARRRAGVLPHRPRLLRCSARTSSWPGARSSAGNRRRANSSRTTTSAASPRARRPSWRRWSTSSTSSASPSRPGTTRSPRASSRSRPIFEEANISTDHNQLTMEILRKVAPAPRLLACFSTRSPLRASTAAASTTTGRWPSRRAASLDGQNLLEPGKTPHQNLRFLLVVMAVLKGVHKHAGLLRAGIASSGNDHRLGANEAPPAIISVFLGDMLSRILDEIEKSGKGSTRAARPPSSASASPSFPKS